MHRPFIGAAVGGLRPLPRLLLTGVLGAMFAVALHSVWSLEGRWFVVVIVGIALLSASIVFAGRFSEFLFDERAAQQALRA